MIEMFYPIINTITLLWCDNDFADLRQWILLNCFINNENDWLWECGANFTQFFVLNFLKLSYTSGILFLTSHICCLIQSQKSFKNFDIDNRRKWSTKVTNFYIIIDCRLSALPAWLIDPSGSIHTFSYRNKKWKKNCMNLFKKCNI